MFELSERLRVLQETVATMDELCERQRFHRDRVKWSDAERRRRDLQLVEVLRPLVRELEERIEALACVAEGQS